MRRLIGILGLSLALTGAFVLGRCTVQRDFDAERTAVSGKARAADTSADDVDAAARVAPGEDRVPTDRATGADAAWASLPGDHPPDTPIMTRAPDTASSPSIGPQPLRQDDVAKLARAESHLAGEGGTWRDLLDLAANEEGDDEARRLEQRIAQAILRHGARYTLLRLAPPHCTRSVCIMRGVGGGQGNDPRSDWQGLSGAIMNEPWFRESFDDLRTSVGGDGGGDGGETVYVTLFVRCDPGNCRLGGR